MSTPLLFAIGAVVVAELPVLMHVASSYMDAQDARRHAAMVEEAQVTLAGYTVDFEPHESGDWIASTRVPGHGYLCAVKSSRDGSLVELARYVCNVERTSETITF